MIAWVPYYDAFKGSVQQDGRGVNSRQKKSVLISYITDKIYFLNLKEAQSQ
jgi:hypothetical protein